MSIRNPNTDPPQPFEPGDESDLPLEPHDPLEPDPMNPKPIPVPPDDEEPPPVPVREPDEKEKPPVREPIRRKPTEIV